MFNNPSTKTTTQKEETSDIFGTDPFSNIRYWSSMNNFHTIYEKIYTYNASVLSNISF